MLVTDSLTIGQLTFILRVILQILSLAGPPLIGLLILANTSRLASFSTHDLINRIKGALSANIASFRWIWGYIRGKTRDPVRSSRLPIGIALLVLYGLFSSLSDIGLLGIYTCSIPAPAESKFDYPASIANESMAHSAITAAFANASNIDAVIARRCDSSSLLIMADGNFTLWNCTAWRNSTWLDRDLFSGINTTDSDMLIPQVMSLYDGNKTTFEVDVGSKRIDTPTIQGGILVNPHDIGFQAVFGVPQLNPNQTFTLNKAMALEVETGCMSLGIGGTRLMDSPLGGIDALRTNGTWRKYSGPDILYDVLHNYTDSIREFWRPAFNTSSLDSQGNMIAENSTTMVFTESITVQDVELPYFGNPSLMFDVGYWLKGNCTNSVREKLGQPPMHRDNSIADSCALLGLGGAVEFTGQIYGAQNHYFCASISQINMVSATVSSDAQGSISLNMTRLPSDLNYLTADYWEIMEMPEINTTNYVTSTPLTRWTLSDNANGPTSHYIIQDYFFSGTRPRGVPSGGLSLSTAGTRAIYTGSALKPIYAPLEELDETDENGNGDNGSGAGGPNDILDPKVLTRWSGQVGASLILASLQYNPWVALDQQPILITTQSTQLAICYHPAYALGFLPLVLAAMLVGSWFIGILVGTSFNNTLRHLKYLGTLYGGLYPYWRSVSPDLRVGDMLLVWRKLPEQADIRLDVIDPDEKAAYVKKIMSDNPKAVNYLASSPAEVEQESELIPEKGGHTPYTAGIDQTPSSSSRLNIR